MDQTRPPTQPAPPAAPAHRTVPRWFLPIVCLALYGPVMALLLWPAAKWLLMESIHLGHYVGVFAGLCLLFAIAAHVIAGHKHSAPHAAPAAHDAKPAPRRIPIRWLLPAAAAALAIAAEMAVHFAATDIHHHMAEALPGAQKLYHNHDIAKLVGQTLSVMTLKARDDEPDPKAKATLKSIAAVIPDQWLKLADEHPDRAVPLSEKELWVFVQHPGAPALDNDRWDDFVKEWTAAAHAAPLEDGPRRRLTAALTTTFSFAWREALKHDYTHNGKATEAMQLDLFGELLRRTAGNANAADPDIKAALAQLKSLPPALTQLADNVRLQLNDHAQTVALRFDAIVATLARIESKIDTALTNDALNAAIKQIDLDPALSPEQKRAQMQPLLTQIIANQPAGTPREPVPAPVQQAVARTFADAPKLVRFGALARIGLSKEADELAAEIERTTARLTDAEKYDFFLARADRYWADGDDWHAATWYAQAMALRVDDPAAVRRAAGAAVSAPGSATYTADVQLAQSWIERALARATPTTNPVDLAGLHAALADTLRHLGRSAESIAPARRALDLLSTQRDAPPGAAYPILLDAALALLYAGDLTPAEAAIDRAIAAAAAYAGPQSASVAAVLATRADMRRARGDYAGAEADIQTTIEWGEKLGPTADPGLAYAYAARAAIRRLRGNAAGAESDIAKSIAWAEAQTPRDEGDLAARYTTRAQIRQDRNDLTGAAADIQRSIDWQESQSPRNERSLAVAYSIRSGIGRDRGDLPNAEADIDKSIAWHESQHPPDQRTLNIHYSARADIRFLRHNLTGAQTDLQKSIAWHESQSPRNERILALRYATRARIRAGLAIAARDSGDRTTAATLFTQAKTDIANTISWWSTNSPTDEDTLTLFRKDQTFIEAESKK